MSDTSTMLVSAKIGPVHLGRDAYVYVRQSTLTQVAGAHREPAAPIRAARTRGRARLGCRIRCG